jgi:hypothetical protein
MLGRRSVAGIGLLVSLVTCLCLAVAPREAPAAFIHPMVNFEFGADGTSGSTLPGPRGLAFNQSADRLYALTVEGERQVFGWSYNGPGSLTPLGGAFPFGVAGGSGDPEIDVEGKPSSSGNLYYAADNGPRPVYTFSATGTELSGEFETEPGEICGLALDSQGHVWTSNWSRGQVEEFLPTGGAPIRIVPTPHGQACHLAIDRETDDIYTSVYGGNVVKYSKASGYSGEGAIIFPTGFDPQAVVNSQRDIIYIASNFGSVVAYSTSGGKVEEFGSSVRDIAVDEETDTVFTASGATNKIQEWRGVVVPDVVTGPQRKNDEMTGSVALAGGGEVLECYFEWRKTSESSYPAANTVPCAPAAPYASDQSEVTATLPSPEAEVSYTYRLVATNANGAGIGGEQALIAHHVRALKTEDATDVERECATLNASFEGNGEETRYWFKYGPTTGYGEETTPEIAGTPAEGVPAPMSTTVCGLDAGLTYHYRVLADNGEGQSEGEDRTFTTDPAIKDILTGPAVDVVPTKATLTGSLDPDGLETRYFFEYGKTEGYGQVTPSLPGADVGTTAPGTVSVSADAEGLEPGTTYHFRIVATNETGETKGLDRTFTTPGPPTIVSFSSAHVTESTAELVGRINPYGYETTWWFEYGTTIAYGEKAPVPAEALAGGADIEDVKVLIAGLKPVTYHFRLVAESKWGRVMTEDQTFDFFPPRGCPNEAERQQTGSGYLPDCRAYELVSAARAGGSVLTPDGPSTAYASNPGRFAYTGSLNAIPGTGPVGNGGFGDLYVANRSTTGWRTSYVGIPSYRSSGYSGPPEYSSAFVGWLGSIIVSPTLDRVLLWDRVYNGFTIGNGRMGNFAPYVYDNEGNELQRLPTNLLSVPNSTLDIRDGGFKGSGMPSADFRHYVFSTNDLIFAEGGKTELPGSVYDNDLQTGSVRVISKTGEKDGNGNYKDIPRDPAFGGSDEYIKVQAVSEDGSHILMSTAGGPEQFTPAGPQQNRHLYMAINQGSQYSHWDVSVGQDGKNHGVKYVGMTNDGSKIMFTSTDKLTADDTDSSADLFVWSSSTHTVTRISTGLGSAGNSDECGASWISGCGVEVVPLPVAIGQGKNLNEDQPYALDSGAVYFYSPEQLEGARGLLGKRNLYVAKGGDVMWVATVDTGTEAISRMNVSSDGRYMAMITKSQLTAYDNAGRSEMYRFDTADRSMLCVSCFPNGEPPTSNVNGSQNGLFMTDDGRTFFSTKDALEPRDANGLIDVYEYTNGRARLISTGTGDLEGDDFRPIGLVGVSADGVDVFFSTYQTLVPEDENGTFLKFYDARTAGGFPYNKPPAPCAAADECHGPETSPPGPQVIGTGAHLGATGNAKPNRRQKRKALCRKRAQKGKAAKRTKRGKRCQRKKSQSHSKRRGNRG